MFHLPWKVQIKLFLLQEDDDVYESIDEYV